MSAKDDANNLDAALRKGTGSARSLSVAIAEGGQNIAHAARAAGELAEAIAKASSAAKFADGIGLVVTLILSAVAAAVLWKEKQLEIAQSIKEIQFATKALNEEARNSPREAAETRITAEKQKQLEAIDKEDRMLGRFGIHLQNYAGKIAAVNAQATAAINNLNAGINRAYGRDREDLASQIRQNDPTLVGKSDEQRQQALNIIARQDAIRHKREEYADKGMQQFQIDDAVDSINKSFDNIAKSIHEQHVKSLGDSLGRSFADSIAGGIVAGIQGGGIAGGFRALLGGILSGLGHLMVEIGTESLLAANLFAGFVDALLAFDPPGAIAASLAMIALGGVLMGAGGAIGSGGRGGGGGGGYGGGGGGTIIDRGIINPLNSSPGSIAARPTNNFYSTFVGPRDPVVQRQFQEIVAHANRRGNVFG
jgi:hypothetical protein